MLSQERTVNPNGYYSVVLVYGTEDAVTPWTITFNTSESRRILKFGSLVNFNLIYNPAQNKTRPHLRSFIFFSFLFDILLFLLKISDFL